MAARIPDTPDGQPGPLDSSGQSPVDGSSHARADERLPDDKRQRFHRYIVLEEIGHGDAGVVYRAFDPDLNREIAVKRLAAADSRPGSSPPPNDQDAVFREAQAVAKLSHPNIVAIHDVGTVEGDVFLAMELVRGQTVARWLAGEVRHWRDVVEVFLAAGEGIAAAHAAGITHRDFRSGQVLIGDDGRVRVTDFGLASSKLVDDTSAGGCSPGEAPAEVAGAAPQGAVASERDSPPRAGSRDRYWAPELRAGATAGPLSDQFSFCAALYEALYGGSAPGREPESVARRSETSSRGTRAKQSVPSRVHRALERGLSTDPAERFPSMQALLQQLRVDPSRLRRRLFTIAAAVASMAMAAWLATTGLDDPAERLCKGAAAEVATTWNDQVRGEGRTAFVASGATYAGATYDRVASVIDKYARGWVTMRTEACAATHIQGNQSDRLLDLRMSCLDRRRAALAALVELFHTDVDAATVEKALPAAFALPSLAGCADESALTAAVPPPEDPGTRRTVDELNRRLADARALEATGRYRDGLAVIDKLSERVEAVPYEPLHAEKHFVAGLLLLGAGEFANAESSLHSAALHAARAMDDALIADSWIWLVSALYEKADYDAALDATAYAEAAVSRAGNKPLHLGLLERAAGIVHHAKGDYQRAIAYHERAVELTESARGADHPDVAIALNALGNSHYVLADYAKARQYYERALAIREKALGSEHPLVAASVYNLAQLAGRQADVERSRKMFERALRLFRSAYGDAHPHTAAAYAGLGVLLMNLGDYKRAEPLLRRALALRESVLGPDHPHTASSLLNLGVVLNASEQHAAAEPYLRQALELWKAKLGPTHPRLGYGLLELGKSLSRRGDFGAAQPHYLRALELQRAGFGEQDKRVAESYAAYADALAHARHFGEAADNYETALAIFRETNRDDESLLIGSLAGLGLCNLVLGRPQRARPLLERALSIGDKHQQGDGYTAAAAEFVLARALWLEAAERPRARALAVRAREFFARDPRPSAAQQVVRIDTWLAEHRVLAANAP